jgi:hypothetical protein
MKSILDKSFVYRDSRHTNIKLTFDRVRRQMREEAKEKKAEVKKEGVILTIEPRLRIR